MCSSDLEAAAAVPEERTASPELAAEIELRIAERAEAKKAKDWARADAIRNELAAKGVLLTDGPAGTIWKLS